MPDLMEFIKIQWADIHHSRNQDWKVLVIIIGVFYALFKVSSNEILLHIAITISGLIVCGMGIYMTIIHWRIFYSKMHVIKDCEKELGIEATFYRSPFPVQGVILLIYFLLASMLSGWLIWVLFKQPWISFVTSIVLFVIGLIISFITNSKIKRVTQNQKTVILKKCGDENE